MTTFIMIDTEYSWLKINHLRHSLQQKSKYYTIHLTITYDELFCVDP